ncbi:DUF5987 family protein [Rhizohabitans arisaemae]|uniref:DUF5987 family protein n=1 Tax=Rhizohabitans arisaemae TaxID=2720610 RepID=UPI0024B0FDF4|nr:DUF5987 family protein [Rhizohabitans arisaemae]
MTLEAFSDTIIPGERRFPGDRAVAGAASGGGAVAAGAVQLLEWDATGVTAGLDDFAALLNEHARAYAGQSGLTLDDSVPEFVALSFEDRTELVRRLVAPGHPEKQIWISIALFANMAYDSAAHMDTAEAIASGHPGLTAMGFALPESDGLWRFRDYSYGRPLAALHPDTTPSGSPA